MCVVRVSLLLFLEASSTSPTCGSVHLSVSEWCQMSVLYVFVYIWMHVLRKLYGVVHNRVVMWRFISRCNITSILSFKLVEHKHLWNKRYCWFCNTVNISSLIHCFTLIHCALTVLQTSHVFVVCRTTLLRYSSSVWSSPRSERPLLFTNCSRTLRTLTQLQSMSSSLPSCMIHFIHTWNGST